jgi:Uma2 family endonuclease
MVATHRQPAPVADIDQRVFLRDVSWKEFELIVAIRGDRAGVRLTYLKGVLELMSPSRSHEGVKKTLARMLEAYAMERGLRLNGYGSWTLKNAPRERGVEPDECYILGDQQVDRPHLAVEVIWTSGGIDKLEVYRGLGVGEVWIWKDDVIQIFLLEGDAYRLAPRSALLPEFDHALAARCLAEAADQTDAVRAFLTALRA